MRKLLIIVMLAFSAGVMAQNPNVIEQLMKDEPEFILNFVSFMKDLEEGVEDNSLKSDTVTIDRSMFPNDEYLATYGMNRDSLLTIFQMVVNQNEGMEKLILKFGDATEIGIKPVAETKSKYAPLYKYRIYLKDKKGNGFSKRHPEEFLSQKSIDRRKRQKIKIKDSDLPLTASYLSEIRNTGAKVVNVSKWNNTVVVSLTDTSVVDVIAGMPFVTSTRKVAEYLKPQKPDTVSHAHWVKPFTANDSTSNLYGKAYTQIKQLNGVALHDRGFKGQGVTVAVIDAGFCNQNVLPIFSNVNVLGWRDFVEPYTDHLFNASSHGTNVLSCIGANTPNVMIGTAPMASFWLLRAEDEHSEQLVEEDNWAAAVEFADSVGVDVVNSSLGYVNFDNKADNNEYSELDGKTALISRTASMMASKGMILCNSAGNSGDERWKKIGVPADADNILAVGAIDSIGRNATFSSVGYSADGRVKPDVVAMGYLAVVADIKGDINRTFGTSFSSPILCGMVATLWSALPKLNAYEIMDIIRQSGDRYDKPDNVFGYGIPDFEKAYEMGKALH